MACIIHKWNGCRCEKCGKIRDKEHDWDGCKCRKCGKKRNEGHSYIYRSRWKNITGTEKNWCEGECRICGNTLYLEHDYQPTDEKCILRCTRCGNKIETHDFKPVPGRYAEVCSICGEERDYLKIAMNKNKPIHERVRAVKRMKEFSEVPQVLRDMCAMGDHIYDIASENRQQFRGGTSSIEYVCVVCGKRYTEVDYGD